MGKKGFIEDLPFQRTLFEKFAEKCRGDLPVLLRLSELHLASGNVDEALRVAVRATILSPESPELQYILACVFALSDQAQFALEHLKLSVKLGFSDLQRMERDQRLQSLRHLASYWALVHSIRNGN
jgi:hypothetical protein